MACIHNGAYWSCRSCQLDSLFSRTNHERALLTFVYSVEGATHSILRCLPWTVFSSALLCLCTRCRRFGWVFWSSLCLSIAFLRRATLSIAPFSLFLLHNMKRFGPCIFRFDLARVCTFDSHTVLCKLHSLPCCRPLSSVRTAASLKLAFACTDVIWCFLLLVAKIMLTISLQQAMQMRQQCRLVLFFYTFEASILKYSRAINFISCLGRDYG